MMKPIKKINHNHFDLGAGTAGTETAGTAGTGTFCLSVSTLTPDTDGVDGAVTPFVILFAPEIPKVGKVSPLSKFCVPLRAITIYEDLITMGAARMFVAS